MKLTNTTSLPAEMLVGSTGDLEQTGIVACKVTYRLVDGGLVPLPEKECWPVITSPREFRGVMLGTEVDFRRQGTDVLVFGQACAPGEKPVTRMRVEVQCGAMTYAVDVIGDRHWTKHWKTIKPTDPLPFAVMPLTNDRAFGGKGKCNGSAAMHATNPDGKGLCFSVDEVDGVQLPNLERPDTPIAKWDDAPVPACLYKPFGLLPDSADMLQKLAASPDKMALPKAVAFRGFNAAVPGMVIPPGQVGKTLRVSGMDAGGDVVFPLPPATAIVGKQGPVVHVAVGPLRSRFPMSISGLMVVVPERLLVVTYLGLFRYLFEPMEIRTAELKWYGELTVPAVRGVTGDGPTRARAKGESTGPVIPPPKPAVVLAPAPLMDKPLPPPPAPPPPSPLVVVKGAIHDKRRVTILLKRTYTFTHGQMPVLAKVQRPLSRTNALGAPGPDGKPGSVSEVVETIAYKGGTDLVVRGQARPREPMSQILVGVAVGGLKHQAVVLGKRTLDVVNGRLFFTPPEKFTAMPLSFENAYGGSDPAFDAEAFDGFEKFLTPEQMRRAMPLYKEMYQPGVPPFVYPRNRVGKGYVLVRDLKKCVGRELPNVELTADRLTPERILVGNVKDWYKMPVPAGFDYLDPQTFPRSAMMGFPPVTGMGKGELASVAEVRMGQVPADYCRGNVFDVEREKIPDLIHEELGRCAAIGLRSTFLRGDESVTLTGMDAKQPEMILKLPAERPHFGITIRGKEHHPPAELFQVFVDVDQRVLTMIWAGAVNLESELDFDEEKLIQNSARVEIRPADQVGHEGSEKKSLLGWLGFKDNA